MNLYHFLFGFQLEKRFGTTPPRQDDGVAGIFCKNGDAGLAPCIPGLDARAGYSETGRTDCP